MLSQRLNEEIEDLKSHPHISNLSLLNDFTIKMTYNPSETTSVYKDKIYGLIMSLPETYPDDPPTLKFLDSIYHLNINYESGEVRMAILEEDWSPFLSLTSIIESLDYIMEQPEQACPFASEILHQYENNRETYLQKVLGSVDYSIQAELCASNGIAAEASPEGNRQNGIANKSSILVQQLRESMMEIQLGGSPIRKNQNKNKRDSQHENLKQSVIIENKQKNAKPSKSIDRASKSIEKKNIQPKSSHYNQSMSHKNATLHNINQTINIFIQEIQEIEEQMAKAKTPAIKAILKARQQSQFQMMKEVVEISQMLKKGLIKKIKEDINKI